MLEYYFKRRSRLLQLRRGPLSEHLDGLARELHLKGYRLMVGQQILSVAGRLSIFARTQGIANASQVDETLTERFIKEELAFEGDFKYAPNALLHLTDYLHRNGVIPTPDDDKTHNPDEELLIRYNTHLCNVRGLAETTRESYVTGARRLVHWFRKQPSSHALSDLRGSEILNYVTDAFGEPYSTVWKKDVCCYTRSFLRYLRWEGIISCDLDRTVPSIPHWRLANIPRHLPWEQVRALVDSVDTDSPEGKRDKAILLLIATLGLRNKEVRSLQLGHIAWKSSEIHLPRTKSLRERVLPLTSEVGEALADYILNGRPKVDNPEVFLSHIAPRNPYLCATGIAQIIGKRLKQAGIAAPSTGAHMLRHSLATHMVNVGVSVFKIADLLGHASIDTTAIYTKVDVNHLASVALPFWEGGTR
ncbi:MAG: site-specific integrase [Sideroxydans sp.]